MNTQIIADLSSGTVGLQTFCDQMKYYYYKQLQHQGIMGAWCGHPTSQGPLAPHPHTAGSTTWRDLHAPKSCVGWRLWAGERLGPPLSNLTLRRAHS